MPNLKEIASYGAMALIVVVIVAYALSGTIFSANYSINVSISQTGNATYPYQISHFTINITNKGNNQVNNLPVGFYLNGGQISTNTISIPAGRSALLTRNYTYPSYGNYTFQAVADPAHLLSIANRQQAQSSISYTITPAQVADIYTTMPNNNIVNTQSFTTTGQGAFGSAAVAQRYNVSFYNQLFGPGENVSLKIFENLAGYIAYANGAYVKYANGSTAYTAWLQGTVNPALVSYVVSSFGIKTTQQDNNSTTFAKLANTVSMCTWYSGGWTKILTYDNSSNKGTCLSFANTGFNSTESQLFISMLKSNPNLTYIQSGFVYTNITPLGSSVSFANNSIAVSNLFTNRYGFFFASTIRKQAKRINVTALNNTCFGLIFSKGKVNVCSYVILTRNGSVTLPYGLINSTEITPDYTISMYSLVNESELVAAHTSASNLINAMMTASLKNETSAIWYTGFRSSCSLNNQSIGCKFLHYNYTSDNATINITNRLSTNITLNKINCELANGFPNTTLALKPLAPNSTASLTFKCYSLPIPATAAITSYTLSLYYTLRNVTRTFIGALNVTNQGLTQSS